MLPSDSQQLVKAIEAPEAHWEFISTIVAKCREYGRTKGYSPIALHSVPKSKYFCAYKQLASARGEGAPIICFENRGEGLCLVFHHVIYDSKGLTIQTTRDKENRRRRIRIDRVFTEDELDHICRLCFQCFDKVFR